MAYDVHERMPYRVGVCNDGALGEDVFQHHLEAMRMAFDEGSAQKLIDRRIELIVRNVDGPPWGSVRAVTDTWLELAHAEQCIAIVGPYGPESSVGVAPHANAVGLPTLSLSGAGAFAGEYCFTLGSGFSDEGTILADAVRMHGLARVGILREANIAGAETAAAFRPYARENGLTLVGEHIVAARNTAESTAAQLRLLRDAGAQAVLYFGLPEQVAPVLAGTRAVLADGNWSPLLLLNSAFAASIAELGAADITALEGWSGLDQAHEDNRVFQGVVERLEARTGRRVAHRYVALGWDIGNMVIRAISQARPHSRDGVKVGLERYRRIPAAAGAPGTLIGFLRWDHRGYKGNSIVLRSIANGRNVVTPNQESIYE
jgi:ABC-type branched-subunit amino acid transport system substrate-binding protein